MEDLTPHTGPVVPERPRGTSSAFLAGVSHLRTPGTLTSLSILNEDILGESDKFQHLCESINFWLGRLINFVAFAIQNLTFWALANCSF